MKGQLYKIAAKGPLHGHDPAGDPVYDYAHTDEFIGFVLKLLPGDTFLIALMKPRELPANAEVVLEVCDPIAMMWDEARRNPAFKSNITKLRVAMKLSELIDAPVVGTWTQRPIADRSNESYERSG